MASLDIARPRADTWLRGEAREDVVADDEGPVDGPIHPDHHSTAFPTTEQERLPKQGPLERPLVDTELGSVLLVVLEHPRLSVAAVVLEQAKRS